MSTLGYQHCFHHAGRESVARCPECGRAFCRECITEHDDRIICASCLQAVLGSEAQPRATRRIPWAVVWMPVQILMGICVGWLCFYTIGRMLLSVPSDFHAGALWQSASEMVEP